MREKTKYTLVQFFSIESIQLFDASTVVSLSSSKRAVFPSDLSDLLPQVADHWWEPLGKSYLLICPHAYNFTLQKVKTAEAAHREHAAKTSPTKAPAPVSHRVMLILPEQPPRLEEVAPMVVDEKLGVTVSAAITGLVLICFY